ncbi:transposase family protein [Pseudoalteromonas sp. Scap03]|uniref:transposase n=1 Tax=unclassified Pseudoalteromonas TaxID=194690 RepID=UPI0015B7C279|nr:MULTISPECIES: transposase [unclassified Pseudoalteromonas]NWL14422.1 transposase family protein [Pseudoalteromonas sp. Scap03]QLE82435.1 transposase family protein [Pseudoalteromonas sp. Scap25]QLE90377.1 transposase family protein [Pseudoalteromonas sp. Scap06]
MSSTQLAVCSDTDVDGIEIGAVLFPADLEHIGSSITEPHTIIFADSSTDRLFAMNLEKDIKPANLSYAEIKESILSGAIVLGTLGLPKYMTIPDSFVLEHQKKKRDEKVERLRPILDNLEEFVIDPYGKGLIKQAMKAGDKTCSRAQVYRDLWKYFRSGCNPNIFLRSPGTGQTINRNYTSKPGPNSGFGRVATEKDERNVIAALNKHYKKSDPSMYLDTVYQKCLDESYSYQSYNPETKRRSYERWGEDRLITEWQFRNIARKYRNKNKKKIDKAKGRSAEVAKNHTALEGTLHYYYDKGIGYYYQVDETPYDVELVCQFDPTRKRRVGKATVYVVRDMSSRTFVGLYITLKNPSADTARAIMFNTFRNKQQFCKEVGIEIGPNDWKQEGKCRNIGCDNAEMAAELSRCYSRDAHISVQFNQEGHSHDKGLVERAFRLLHDAVKGQVDGYSPNNVPSHIKRLLRQKALLNINELYQILITYIIIYNNYSLNKGIELSKEMYMDGVKQIPGQVWDWDKRNRAGYLKHVNDFELYGSLLEVGEVTCLPTHISLKGFKQKYTCEWTKANEYQKKGGTSPKLPCRYMRHSMDVIFIETPDGFQPAIQNGSLFKHVSVEEIEAEQDIIHEENKQIIKNHKAKQGKTRALIEDLQANARLEQEKITVNDANTQPIKEHRNVHIEREIEQDQARHSMYLADQYRLVEVQEVETSQSRLTDNNSAPIESARARRIRENREKTNNRGKKNDS